MQIAKITYLVCFNYFQYRESSSLIITSQFIEADIEMIKTYGGKITQVVYDFVYYYLKQRYQFFHNILAITPIINLT